MNLYFCLFLQEKDTKRLRFFQFYKRQNVMAANMINTLKRVSQYYTKRYLISLCHCGYIFLLDSSAQDLNSFSLLTKHGQGKRGVLENKNKRATRKIRIAAGRPQCMNRPRFLTFLKMNSRPPAVGMREVSL